ncbi:hypothetical protein BC628DRAFT_990851 [Trametes gibbosa]|nr:hypothetical protein BC628DRAFT_990851 [Trametes gibbosa]
MTRAGARRKRLNASGRHDDSDAMEMLVTVTVCGAAQSRSPPPSQPISVLGLGVGRFTRAHGAAGRDATHCVCFKGCVWLMTRIRILNSRTDSGRVDLGLSGREFRNDTTSGGALQCRRLTSALLRAPGSKSHDRVGQFEEAVVVWVGRGSTNGALHMYVPDSKNKLEHGGTTQKQPSRAATSQQPDKHEL